LFILKYNKKIKRSKKNLFINGKKNFLKQKKQGKPRHFPQQIIKSLAVVLLKNLARSPASVQLIHLEAHALP